MEALRQALRPEEVQFVARVEDDSGVLKLVIIKADKVEISGVPCTLPFAQSFGMWYSLITGRLTSLDIPLLVQEFPDLYWATWTDVLEVIRNRLENVSVGDLNLIIAKILGCIPVPAVAEDVRGLLIKNPYYLFDLFNGSRTPSTGGKMVLGTLWWHYGVYKWVASTLTKKAVWNGPVGSDLLPGPSSPFSSAKSLERLFGIAIPHLLPTLKIRPPASAVIPGTDVAQGGNASDVPGAHPPVSVSAEPGYGSLADVLTKVVTTTRDLPPESLPKAMTFLNSVLSPIASVAKLPSMLATIKEPLQLSAALAGFSWPHGVDAARVTHAMQSWLTYVDASHLVAATVSVKQRYLDELLSLMPKADVCWTTLAMQLMVSLGDHFTTEALQKLVSVNDRASMAWAIAELTLSTGQISSLKEIKAQLQRLVGAGPSCPPPEWATMLVNQYLDKGSSGQPASVEQGGASMTSPSASGSNCSTLGLTGICLRVEGPTKMPWPALQAALAAHFAEDVYVARQSNPMVQLIYASVATAWARTAAGRSFWRIPLGSGLSATVTNKRLNGTPVEPPLYTASPQAITDYLQSQSGETPVGPLRTSLGKRHRSPPPVAGNSSRPPRPLSHVSTSSRGAVTMTPSFRGGARALITQSWPARRGPGNL